MKKKDLYDKDRYEFKYYILENGNPKPVFVSHIINIDNKN